MLDSFSYSVSHDLRAPLRAIDGFSRMLEEDYAQRLDDEGRRFLATIRESALRMGQLIEDLLQLSRLGRKPISAGDIDMTALAGEALQELQANTPKTPAPGPSYRRSPGRRLRCARLRLVEPLPRQCRHVDVAGGDRLLPPAGKGQQGFDQMPHS